jgi:hypothetical protein
MDISESVFLFVILVLMIVVGAVFGTALCNFSEKRECDRFGKTYVGDALYVCHRAPEYQSSPNESQ